MTPKEIEAKLKELGIETDRILKTRTGNGSINMPKSDELVELLESIKELMTLEMQKKEAEVVALKEELVKKKRGGCNG